MAIEEEGQPGLALTDKPQERPGVVAVVAPIADVAPLAQRAAVPAKVKRVERTAARREVLEYVAVAAAVLAMPMEDGQSRPGAAVRPPRLGVELEAADAAEPAASSSTPS